MKASVESVAAEREVAGLDIAPECKQMNYMQTKQTSPMHNKTPEERKAIAAKSHAARRANREAREAERREALKRADSLYQHIAQLEERLASLQHMETFNYVSATMTSRRLLSADEIVKVALPWKQASGIYFLIDGDSVVYVGQATNVYSRIAYHSDKKFSHYAFVPCDSEALNKIESLYIHYLRPKLNGEYLDGSKYAPISMADLLSTGSTEKGKK